MGNKPSLPAAAPVSRAQLLDARVTEKSSTAAMQRRCPSSGGPGCVLAAPSAEEHQEMLQKAAGLQQQLAEISASPLLGLQDAADTLAEQLAVDHVSIWVIPRADPTASVLMAAQGAGVAVLQRAIVLPIGLWGAGRWLRAGTPAYAHVCDASDPQGPAVEPADLWRGPAALRSFVQAPIGPPSAPMGALLLASAEPGAFGAAEWQLQVQLAAAGLMAHVRHAQVQLMAQLMRRLDGIEDPLAMVGALLKGAGEFMQKSCAQRTSPRLALLQPSTAADGAPSEALLFELQPPASAAAQRSNSGSLRVNSFSHSHSLGGALSAASEDDEGVAASRLRLHNTLLGAAVAQQQARFVADVGAYMQSSPRPARDVFTRASTLVSSIVVVPIVAGAAPPLGGLYFALDGPCEFGNMQDTLLGFIGGVTPFLYGKLFGRAAALASSLQDARRLAAGMSSCPLPVLQKTSRCGGLAHPDDDIVRIGAMTLSDSSSLAAHHPEAAPPAASASCRLPSIATSDRLNTEAMVTLLQRDIQSKRRVSAETRQHGEVAIGQLLSQDSSGPIYAGVWHRVPVAVKVRPTRACERAAMQDAVEMAVLSSVQHPNIVTVYACLTDMVETEAVCGSAGPGSRRGLDMKAAFRRLAPEELHDDDIETCNLIVMEPCDRGTLRDALGTGLLHRRLACGALAVDVDLLLGLLLDVAYALRHLHALELMHGDVRPESIMLKADATRPAGVAPKLAGFGRTRILSGGGGGDGGGGGPASAAAAAAHAAHLAPELLSSGAAASPAVDAYAFGILMWEAYTRGHAFAGLAPGDAAARVRDQGLRPRFHSSAPRCYVDLAKACWAADPAARPSAAQITERLEAIAAAWRDEAARTPPRAAGAPGAAGGRRAAPASAQALPGPRDGAPASAGQHLTLPG